MIGFVAVVIEREVVISDEVIEPLDSELNGSEVVIGELPVEIGESEEVRPPVDMILGDVVISNDVTKPVDSCEESVVDMGKVVIGELPVEIGESEEVIGSPVVTGLVVKDMEVKSPEVIGPFTTMTVAVADVAVQFPASRTVTV